MIHDNKQTTNKFHFGLTSKISVEYNVDSCSMYFSLFVTECLAFDFNSMDRFTQIWVKIVFDATTPLVWFEYSNVIKL